MSADVDGRTHGGNRKRPELTVVALLVIAVTMAACASSSPVPPPTLRAVASARGLAVGSAVSSGAFRNDPEYRHVLSAQFGMLTPENALKWPEIHPSQYQFDFSGGDALVAFARDHGMTVRGHNLVWAKNNPGWLEHGTWTRDQLLRILHMHIDAVVGHYRGKIAQWDVVNEVVNGRGELGNSIWLRTIGPQYIDLAFRWAHEADPKALLFDNEDANGEAHSAKEQGILKLVRGLRQRGVPISGVGIETHTGLDAHLGTRVSSFMRALSSLGVDAAITEMDVALPDAQTGRDLEMQAHIYADVLDACLHAPNCHTFVTWGFTDRYSWIPGAHPGMGHALIFDESYRPKPAFRALVSVLNSG